MRKATFLLVSLVAILVFACGMPASPTPPTVEGPTPTLPTLTSTPTHTSTPVSTATEKPATPTLTVEPGLRTEGPYFAYFQQKNLILRLVLVDADGGGRRVIELPKAISDAYAYATLPAPDIRFVSPDGRWLAYYTGSAGKYGPLPTQGTFDLALNLFDLETGEIRLITPLLSKEYPNNFVEAAQLLNNPEITADYLYQAFVEGITRSLAWSPDGKYLAFGGQMDGLSSDLYLYDMAEKTIQRLSSGDQELQWIEWSPDGKWIIHSSVYGVGAGMTYEIYAASVDGFLRYLSTNILHDGIEDWINDRQYLESDGENVLGTYGLRLVDIETGNITKLWDGSFYAYVVNSSGTWVVLPGASQFLSNDPNFVPNLYLINLKSLERYKVEVPDNMPGYGDIRPFGPGGQEFVFLNQIDSNPAFLSADGIWTPTDLGGVNLSVSPNSENWLAVGEDLKIFSADNILVKTVAVSLPIYSSFSWRPDSSGVFLIADSEIYSVNVPEGETELIETNLMDGQGLHDGWVSGQ